ncbi:MAG: TetR/AcrR family transcriptional regulator [Qingshengfaniella sp.]
MTISVARRRELILDALDAVFHDTGSSGTTMEAVARKAGMSKRTVYAQFADRHELFCAYIARFRGTMIRPLDADEIRLPLEDRLRQLLRPRETRFSDDLAVAALRAAIAESLTDCARARQFWQDGFEQIVGLIRDELDRGNTRGEIHVADTEMAAILLKDMAFCSPMDILLIGRTAPDLAYRQARFELALTTFLHGLPPGHAPAMPVSTGSGVQP